MPNTNVLVAGSDVGSLDVWNLSRDDNPLPSSFINTIEDDVYSLDSLVHSAERVYAFESDSACILMTSYDLVSETRQSSVELWRNPEDAPVTLIPFGSVQLAHSEERRCLFAPSNRSVAVVGQSSNTVLARIGPFDGCVTSLGVNHQTNELIIPILGDAHCEVFVADIRMIETRDNEPSRKALCSNAFACSFSGAGQPVSPIQSCSVIEDRGCFVLSYGDKLDCLTHQSQSWKRCWSWGIGGQTGGKSCTVVDDFESSGYRVFITPPSDLDEQTTVIIDSCGEKSMNVAIVWASGTKRIRVPRCLVSSSPLVDENNTLDNPVQLVNLEAGVDIDERELLEVLLGRAVQDPKLYSYYRLFDELRLPKHAVLCCVALDHVAFPILVKLSQSCSFPRLESRMSVSEDEIPNVEFDAFSECIIRRLYQNRKQIVGNVGFSNSLKKILPYFFLSKDCPFWNRTAWNHPLFSDLREKSHSFIELARKTCAELFNWRSSSGDVVLVTEDGGEEKAHLPILVSRSRMFMLMMRFKGIEYTSFQETGRIEIADISHSNLLDFLSLLYTDNLDVHRRSDAAHPPSIYDLLSVALHAAKYEEKRVLYVLKRELIVRFKKMNKSDLMSCLIECGWMLKLVNKDLRDWFLNHLGGMTTKIGALKTVIELSSRLRKRSKVVSEQSVTNDGEEEKEEASS